MSVDVAALNKFYHQLKNLNKQGDFFLPGAGNKRVQFCLNCIAELRHAAYTKRAGKNYIYHRYEEVSTGRLFATGHINLQNAPREVRSAALINHWDYDFENCHYSILCK